tara:strand:+ start:3121 stop:3300 length:180 start_codon:yes stop_codon:yes gene_type:complete
MKIVLLSGGVGDCGRDGGNVTGDGGSLPELLDVMDTVSDKDKSGIHTDKLRTVLFAILA